eukprot:jgi/Mesvir1/23708/Mv18657-RA.1
MLAQGTTGITNDEEPNGDSSEEDTDVGEALAGAKEEQAQGFRPPGASTVAGAPGAVFPAVFGHMAPVVGGDGRKQLANAGRSLANAAGASFGGGEGVSAVPRSGTLKAGARGGGKEEKAGLPRSAKGDGAAGMGLSPEMMAQMNALMGGFQQLGIGGAQGLGAAVRVPAPSVQEGGAWGGRGQQGPALPGGQAGPMGTRAHRQAWKERRAQRTLTQGRWVQPGLSPTHQRVPRTVPGCQRLEPRTTWRSQQPKVGRGNGRASGPSAGSAGIGTAGARPATARAATRRGAGEGARVAGAQVGG